MVSTSVVDAEGIAVAGRPINIVATLQQGGSAVNLSGKTVRATVRWQGNPTVQLDASLEGTAVTVTTAASGIVTLALDEDQTAALATDPDPTKTRSYLVTFEVVDDDYEPQMLRFKARSSIAGTPPA